MTAPWLDRAVKRPKAAPLAFLTVISIVLGLTTPGFWSGANVLNIISQVAVVGIVSLALNQVILSGEIDVSIGSLLAARACTYATIGHVTASPVLPLLAALGIGLGIGALNGLIVTIGRVPSIIAPLGMLLGLRGVVLLIGANGLLLVPDGARAFGLGSVAGLRVPILALLAVFALFDLVNRNTSGAAIFWRWAATVAPRMPSGCAQAS